MGIYLKNLVAFSTGQSRFLTVGSLPLETLQSSWKHACKGMEFALNFLKSNTGIDNPALLSSPFIIITLAFYGYRRDYDLSPEEEAQLKYWTLLANAKGRYSRGSSETILDQDLAILRKGGAKELIDRLRQQVGRLSIVPGELEGRNQRSALFKTMFLAFKASGAKDWNSQLAIGLKHSGSQHRLQFHHIFPKDYLKGSYTQTEINDIANLSFIGGKTNRKISNKAPKLYFPIIREKAGDDAFSLQCIPTNPELLEAESYKDFLAERRARIADRLNEFLGTPPDGQ